MQDAYGAQGLTVVGVTGGEEQATAEWVDRLGVRYAYALDPGYTWDYRFNLFVYPAAILVDPAGVVVWKGHPDALPEKLLRKVLRGALREPLHEWPDAVGDVREAVQAHDFGRARSLAAEACSRDEELRHYADLVEALLAQKLGAVERLLHRGDVLGARAIADSLHAGLEGSPEAARLASFDERIAAAARELEAQTTLIESWDAPLYDRQDVDALLERTQELGKRFPEGPVSEEADLLVGFLRWTRSAFPEHAPGEEDDKGNIPH